jgi:Domain of unknown function (DUF4279)
MAEEIDESTYEHWTRVTFRASSPSRTAEELARIVGITPTRSVAKGEPVTRRTPNAPIRKSSGILLESGVSEHRHAEAHLEALLTVLEPLQSRLEALPADVTTDLFIGFSSGSGQGGFFLSPGLLRRLAHLGLALVTDLYPPEHESSA